MITNKIKSLLVLKGFSFSAFATQLGISRQSLNNKSKVNAYKINDLIELSKLTNTRLSFIDNETNKELISFDEQDIKENDN